MRYCFRLILQCREIRETERYTQPQLGPEIRTEGKTAMQRGIWELLWKPVLEGFITQQLWAGRRRKQSSRKCEGENGLG